MTEISLIVTLNNQFNSTQPMVNLTRTYENKYILYIWITKGYCYEIRGEKTHGRDKLYVRSRGGGIVKVKIEEGVIDKKILELLSPKILGRGRGETKCKITRRMFISKHR